MAGCFSDHRHSYDSDLLEQLRSVVCDLCFETDLKKKAAEIIEELERRATMRELGHTECTYSDQH